MIFPRSIHGVNKKKIRYLSYMRRKISEIIPCYPLLSIFKLWTYACISAEDEIENLTFYVRSTCGTTQVNAQSSALTVRWRSSPPRSVVNTSPGRTPTPGWSVTSVVRSAHRKTASKFTGTDNGRNNALKFSCWQCSFHTCQVPGPPRGWGRFPPFTFLKGEIL